MARALLHLSSRSVAMARAKESEHLVLLPENVRTSRVLILGGTGRVGGSTATALSKLCPDLRIVVAGRNKEKGVAAVAKLGRNSEFVEVDIDDMESLEAALYDVDLVVHAAGPFQQAERCTVLEAAIKTKVRNRQHILMYVMIQAIQGVQNRMRIKHWPQIYQP